MRSIKPSTAKTKCFALPDLINPDLSQEHFKIWMASYAMWLWPSDIKCPISI